MALAWCRLNRSSNELNRPGAGSQPTARQPRPTADAVGGFVSDEGCGLIVSVLTGRICRLAFSWPAEDQCVRFPFQTYPASCQLLRHEILARHLPYPPNLSYYASRPSLPIHPIGTHACFQHHVRDSTWFCNCWYLWHSHRCCLQHCLPHQLRWSEQRSRLLQLVDIPWVLFSMVYMTREALP